jgi:hypothetical protein
MSDQDPFRQPDPVLRDRVGSRWIVLLTVAVVVLLAALFYGMSHEPHDMQTARISSDQTSRAASGTTHQGVPNPVQNGTPAPSKP